MPPRSPAAAGNAFLDQLRASFLSRMERVKGELTTMADDAGGCCTWLHQATTNTCSAPPCSAVRAVVRSASCKHAPGFHFGNDHCPNTSLHFPPPMAAPAEEEALRLQSASTLDCCRRADLTAALIAKLGIKTADVEQQRPDTIESVQEEAPSAAEAGTQ